MFTDDPVIAEHHNELAADYVSVVREAAVSLARPQTRLRTASVLQLLHQALAAGP